MLAETNLFARPVGAKTVLRLAWPVVISMLSFTATSVVDVLVVGWLGTVELAAVGLAVTALYLVRAMGFGLLSGVRIATAQATGAERTADVGRLGWQAAWMSLVLTALSLPGLWLGRPLFALSGASDEVAALAGTYLDIRLAGVLFSYLLFALTAWRQGGGDTRSPMVANLVSNGLNVALTPLLVFGLGPVPALGIGGAAWATVFGTIVGTFILLRPLLRSTSEWRPSRELLSRVWTLGWPLGLSWTLDVGSFAGFTAVLATCGDAHLAAHVLVVRIISVSFLPGHAIAEATGVLTGQAVGAGRSDAAVASIWAGLRVACAVMLACGLGFWLFPQLVLMPFGVEPEVVSVAVTLLFIAGCFQVFDAVAMVLYQGMAGAGDTRFVTVITTLGAWTVKLPLGYALALHAGLGASGAWMGITAEIIVVAAILGLRMRSGRWLASDDKLPAAVPAK